MNWKTCYGSVTINKDTVPEKEVDVVARKWKQFLNTVLFGLRLKKRKRLLSVADLEAAIKKAEDEMRKEMLNAFFTESFLYKEAARMLEEEEKKDAHL